MKKNNEYKQSITNKIKKARFQEALDELEEYAEYIDDRSLIAQVITLHARFSIDFKNHLNGLAKNSEERNKIILALSHLLDEAYDIATEKIEESSQNTSYYLLYLEYLSNIKKEFQEVKTKTKKMKYGIETESIYYYGKDALAYVVRTINKGVMDDDTINEWYSVRGLVNIYCNVDNIIVKISDDRELKQIEKKILIEQVKLFYLNNLHVLKKERGDEFCIDCKTTHKFPEKWISKIHNIERNLNIQ